MQAIEIKAFDPGLIKKQMDHFSKFLKSGKPLTAKDLELYDQLFEVYKSLKYGAIYQKVVGDDVWQL